MDVLWLVQLSECNSVDLPGCLLPSVRCKGQVGLAFAICACAILLVVDIVSVAIIDVRRKRKQPGLKD